MKEQQLKNYQLYLEEVVQKKECSKETKTNYKLGKLPD